LVESVDWQYHARHPGSWHYHARHPGTVTHHVKQAIILYSIFVTRVRLFVTFSRESNKLSSSNMSCCIDERATTGSLHWTLCKVKY
jgi:hypothetical protein